MAFTHSHSTSNANIVPADLANLLSSNANPTPQQLAVVQREVALRQEELDSLRLRVQQLEIEAQTFRVFLSPLRRGLIPPEILAEIFQDVLSMVEDHCKDSAQVLTICLVCKHWREVAIATPHLWTYLRVSLTEEADTLDNVQLWVDRAGQIPKTLRISGTRGAHEPSLDEGCPLKNMGLARLLATTPSIKHLSLQCQEMGCLQTLIYDLVRPLAGRGSWYTVQSLELEVERDIGEEDPIPRAQHFFSHIPSSTALRFALTDGSEDPWEEITPTELDLANTKRLTLVCDWGVPWVLRSLGTGTNLVEVTLDFMQRAAWIDGADTGPPVVLQHLRVMRMRRMMYANDETEVFHRITMPALETLDLSFYDDCGPNDETTPSQVAFKIASSLQGLADRSRGQFRLQYLRLNDIGPFPFSEEDLEIMFSPVPSLVHLILDDVSFDPEFFTSIASAPTDDTEILPNLKRLEILNIDTAQESFHITSLLPFFDSRMRPGRPGGVMEKIELSVQRPEVLKTDYKRAQRKLDALGHIGKISVVDQVDYSDMSLFAA